MHHQFISISMEIWYLAKKKSDRFMALKLKNGANSKIEWGKFYNDKKNEWQKKCFASRKIFDRLENRFSKMKNCMFEHMPNVIWIACGNFEKAAPSVTNINFLNFCSNCQMVTKKVELAKKSRVFVAVFFFSIGNAVDGIAHRNQEIK